MGLPGLETLLPIVYTHGVLAGRLTLAEFVAKCTTNPAKIMGLYPRKGVLAVGSDADITIIDPGKRIEVDHARMETNADWSPYQGWSLAGFAETTFSRGRKIVANYQFVGESGWGRWLPRERAGSLAGRGRGLRAAGQRLRPRIIRKECFTHDFSGRRAAVARGAQGTVRRCAAAARDRSGAYRSGTLPVLLRCSLHAACPTHIDVPRFIRQILHHDEISAAETILDANIFGGSCARACPTEVLCEGACVDRTLMKAPVQIGRLQRFACDTATSHGISFFQPGKPSGKRIAIVGSGPAGLSCAHELRRRGHDVVVFEARDVPGGLDALGIAAYKISTEFALSEIAMIRQIGIDIKLGHRVSGAEVTHLLETFDAVFLGIGLGRTHPLNIEGEHLEGVWEALDFIFQTHTRPFSECVVGVNVLVIGAGNTAVDAATAAKRLGAETVTIAYRRTEAQIPAFAYEYELARSDGIRFEWLAQPIRIVGDQKRAHGVEFLRTELQKGSCPFQ